MHISFLFIGEEICELKIADTGIGLPEGFDPENTESLGMSLIVNLTEQLNGEIKMWNDDGLVLDVIFKRHNELITETSALLINKN